MTWGQRGRAQDNARVEQLMVYGDYYARVPDRTPAAARTLPDAPEALVGRERELGELLAVLAPGSGARAVVVAGLAGVGKSALAVTAAERALERGWFTGGVLYLSLRGYDPAGAVGSGQAVGTLLEGLGVVAAELPAGRDGQLARYRSELATRAGDGRRVLVVADDAGDAAQIRDLVPPGGDVHRLLVTSRDRLVAPDFRARVLDLEVLGAGAAGELIADALHRVRPDDPRPRAEAAALTEVAGHCGRLPLALSVAAAVLAGDPGLRAAELARRLADARTRLEALSPRDRAGIPTGVRAAFGLSYARLPEGQQRLLRLLTAVPGPDCETGFAASTLCGPVAEADWDAAAAGTRALLAALAGAGLLAEWPKGSQRWRMHDLVRLYAAELAAAHAEEDGREAVVDQVLTVYLGMVIGAEDHLLPRPGEPKAPNFPDAETALHWLDGERVNLLAAVSFCAAHGRPAKAATLAVRLSGYLSRRRLFDDAIANARIGVEAARRAEDEEAEYLLLSALATALWETSRSEEAVELGERILAFYSARDDEVSTAVALGNLASWLSATGRLEEARTAIERSVVLLRSLGARETEGEALTGFGLILAEQGLTADAARTLEHAVGLLSAYGESLGRARALGHLASALVADGRADEAIPRFREAAAMFRRVGERYEEGATMQQLGLLLRELDRLDESAGALWEAAHCAMAAGESDQAGTSLTHMGVTMLALSDAAGAVSVLNEALRQGRYAGDPAWSSDALFALGTAYTGTGDFARSAAAHFEAAGLFRQAGQEDWAALALESAEVALREAARHRGPRGLWRRLRTRFRRR